MRAGQHVVLVAGVQCGHGLLGRLPVRREDVLPRRWRHLRPGADELLQQCIAKNVVCEGSGQGRNGHGVGRGCQDTCVGG